MSKNILAIFFLFLTILSSSAFADQEDNYFVDAGRYYDVNHILLKAIAQAESGQNPNALNCANNNGSCDYGIMQINSVHLPMLNKHGISANDLFNEKTNIYIGAWVLKGCINKYGVSYKSLNCYNGKINGNNYYSRVLNNYWKFAKQADESVKKEALMYTVER